MRLASVLLLLAPLAACVRLGSITRRAPHPLASAATALATPVAAAGLDPDAAFEAAVRHCEKEEAESVEDIARHGGAEGVTELVKALGLPRIPESKLRKSLEALQAQAPAPADKALVC